MMKSVTKAVAIAVAVAAMVGAGGVAAAVDAPKWVAVVYMEAQKSVGLRWSPVAGATGYKVLRSTTPGKDYKEIATASQPQHFDKEFEPGSAYYYVLQAVAGAETGPLSDERSVTIPGVKKVEAVTVPPMERLTLTESTEFGKTNFRVGVFWGRSTNPAVVAYNLYRTTVPGKDYQMLSSGQDNKYVDAAVEVGKTYYYAVSALDNQFQETPFSPEMSIAVVKAVKEEKKTERKELQKIIPRPTKLQYALTLRDYPVDLELLPDDVLAVASSNLYLFKDYSNEEAVPLDISMGWENFSGVGATLDGDLIAVGKSNGVRIYKADGSRVIQEWNGREEQPGAFFMDADQAPDGTIYVTDNNHRILMLDEKLKFIGAVTIVNKDDPDFKIMNPTYIKIGTDGTKYINSGGDSAVFLLDKDNKVIRVVGEMGAQVGTFGKIRGTTLDKEGDLFVADMQNANVQVFNRKGDFIYLLTDETKKANLQVFLPSGITLSRDEKKLFVANSMRKTINVFDLLPFGQ